MSEALAAAVRALAVVLRGGELAVVRDADALAELQRRFRLPAVYVEFLRAHSSHGYVDAGLVCDGAPVWLTPVDTVAEIHACFPGLPREWLVCAIADEGCYALALERSRGDDCPVMFVRGGAREVAPGFVAFLRRIAGDTAASRRSAPRVRASVSRARFAWLAAAMFVAAALVGYGLG